MSRARWMSEHMHLSTHVETDTDRAAVGGKRVEDGAAVPLGTLCATFRKRPPGILADVAALAARSRLHSPITEAPTHTRNPAATPAASGLLCATGDIVRLSVPTCEMGQGHITERVSRKGEHFLAWDSHRASPSNLPNTTPTLGTHVVPVPASLSGEPHTLLSKPHTSALMVPPGEACPRSLSSFIS